MSRTNGKEYLLIANGLTADQVAAFPDGAGPLDPLTIKSNSKILTAAQAASFPVGANLANPLALASDARFATADQKASFPATADADNQIMLDGRYENDLSAVVDAAGALLDPDWSLYVPVGSTITTVANRLQLHHGAGAGLPRLTLNSPTFDYLPISMQLYMYSAAPVLGSYAWAYLNSFAGTAIANKVILQYGNLAGGFFVASTVTGVNTIVYGAPAMGCWLRTVLLGGIAQGYYSTNLETDPPSESDWIKITVAPQTVSSIMTPSYFNLMLQGPVALASTYAFSNLTIQRSVQYVP